MRYDKLMEIITKYKNERKKELMSELQKTDFGKLNCADLMVYNHGIEEFEPLNYLDENKSIIDLLDTLLLFFEQKGGCCQLQLQNSEEKWGWIEVNELTIEWDFSEFEEMES